MVLNHLRLVALTQHCADLIGQNGVGVVQPAASTKALFEAVKDWLIGEQHHQNPQSCCDCGRVKVFLHEHQEPIKTESPNQFLTRSAEREGLQISVTSKNTVLNLNITVKIYSENHRKITSNKVSN